MVKTFYSRLNFWTILFSKIMPNFWLTDIPHGKFKKKILSRPTVFEIPQPNWHYYWFWSRISIHNHFCQWDAWKRIFGGFLRYSRSDAKLAPICSKRSCSFNDRLYKSLRCQILSEYGSWSWGVPTTFKPKIDVLLIVERLSSF